MSADHALLASLLATNNPALPGGLLMRCYLPLGWAVVLAALAIVVPGRLAPAPRRMLAVALAVWALLPGPWSPTYWLGLAFQAPSVASVLLCGWVVWRRWVAGFGQAQPAGVAVSWIWLLPAVAMGYVLLLDTLAWLPWPIFHWGFSTALLLVCMGWALLPWLLRGEIASPVWVAPVALLVFAVTRLPTGNVWDALLDPWLWLGLQVLGGRAACQRRQAV